MKASRFNFFSVALIVLIFSSGCATHSVNKGTNEGKLVWIANTGFSYMQENWAEATTYCGKYYPGTSAVYTGEMRGGGLVKKYQFYCATQAEKKIIVCNPNNLSKAISSGKMGIVANCAN